MCWCSRAARRARSGCCSRCTTRPNSAYGGARVCISARSTARASSSAHATEIGIIKFKTYVTLTPCYTLTGFNVCIHIIDNQYSIAITCVIRRCRFILDWCTGARRFDGSVSVDDLMFIDCTPTLAAPNRQCNPLVEFQCEGDPRPANILEGRYPTPKHCIKESLLCDFTNDCGEYSLL